MELDFKCPLTAEELEAAKQSMIDSVWDWVMRRYPNIRLENVERNLAALTHIKQYDDACKNCFGVQQCPTLDGNRMEGTLCADGVISVYYTSCPKHHRISGGTGQKESGWRRKE